LAEHSSVNLDSSDKSLVRGFQWAKRQALAYVFRGDPVGDWFEAALPGREAFCMRDVAHQATGGQVLGLADCVRNMLRRFAENTAASRDWCSYWEIDRRNLPCPADYRDDNYFWYNLPANFDALDCCFRQYLWTGDRIYLEDSAFRYFYSKTVAEYVAQWDKDADGIPEHYPEYGFRGIATYNEAVPHPLVGGDLVAAQFGAYRAYANILEITGSDKLAEAYRAKAEALRQKYRAEWWAGDATRFYSLMRQDRSFSAEWFGLTNFFPLYFGLVENDKQAQSVLDDVVQHRRSLNVEERSYLPAILYKYGRHEVAYEELMEHFDPSYERKEYPEVSYAAIGSVVTGMMGIEPDSRERTIATCSRLTDKTGWVEMTNIPIFDNLVTIKHFENAKTQLLNVSGLPFYWKAAFSGEAEELLVDGENWSALQGRGLNGQPESWVIVRVGRGESRSVGMP